MNINTTRKEAQMQKHHLEIIVLADDDAEITVENIANAACILLINMYREKHEKHKNMEKKAVKKKGRPSKRPNLKPSCYGNSVYLRELAEWAGMSVASLRAQMENLAYLHDEIEYFKSGPDDTVTLTAKGANAVAKALDLEKAE